MHIVSSRVGRRRFIQMILKHWKSKSTSFELFLNNKNSIPRHLIYGIFKLIVS